MGLERLVFVTKSVKRNVHIPWLQPQRKMVLDN